MYINKKDSTYGQQTNLSQSLLGSAELPLDDQPVVIIMNKCNFVLLQSDVLRFTEHTAPQGTVNIIAIVQKDYQDEDISISAYVNINSSPFPLLFRMI